MRALFKAPAWLYRAGAGSLLGKRVLAVTHRGRKSGKLYETVLEVVAFDPERGESVVASAYGTGADWYRNLQAGGALRVRTWRLDYVPAIRFLAGEEAGEVAAEYCRRHPWAARLLARELPAIGSVAPPGDPVSMVSSLPMVAFRPS
ncbi:MAG TPA: nitroreductase family deazaflavin-dependent oxidoreductase [Longimicrobiales bacterium]|nr:nitroreductase family deazaflavin-dependent oxidoreductase [Longimicrobiales bacterium]